MWEGRKRQELNEAAIAVHECNESTIGGSQYYRSHAKMKGYFF